MGNRKQMMDIRACKGFTVQESNEHRRNWDGHRWERALHEGNYDLTRQHLNFEIVKGGKIQPIDKSKTIPQMMKERLAALGIKDPNEGKLSPDRRTVVEMVLGGNRERMLELAFGNQDYNTLSHTKDHSHLHRMPEIEEWAKDVYDWCCRKWGEDNILSFVAHLDEVNPHLHCVLLPITPDNKLSYRKVFVGEQNTQQEYRQRMLDLHTSLAEEVNDKWGLSRGDDIYETNARHRSTEEYKRDLTHECNLLENQRSALEESIQTGRAELASARTKVRALTTMVTNKEHELENAEEELSKVNASISRGEGDVEQLLNHKRMLEAKIEQIKEALADKREKLAEADKEYERVRKALNEATEQLKEKTQAIVQAEQHIHALGQQTKVASHILRSNYDFVIKAALYDNLIGDFQQKAPLLNDDKAVFDNTVLQDFSEDGKNLFTCTLLLMTDMMDKATDFAQTHGGGGNTSKLPWRGRDKDEDDIAWARRCAMHARSMMKPASGAKRKR